MATSGGNIRIKASNEGAEASNDDPLRFPTTAGVVNFVDRDAVLDVSGASVRCRWSATSSRWSCAAASSPTARSNADGALRGAARQVDVRRAGTREDGSTWHGTPLADLSGDISTVARSVAERTSRWRHIDLALARRHHRRRRRALDVSGGASITRTDSSAHRQLLGADGRVYDIGDADPKREYVRRAARLVVRREASALGRHARNYAARSPAAGTLRGRLRGGQGCGIAVVARPQVMFDGELVAIVSSVRASASRSTALRPAACTGRSTSCRSAASCCWAVRPALTVAFVVGDIAIDAGSSCRGCATRMVPRSIPCTIRCRASVDAVRMSPGTVQRRRGDACLAPLGSLGRRARGHPALSAGIQLAQHPARNIDFGGCTRVPAASDSLQARRTTTGLDSNDEELRLRSSAHLDLSGTWINESDTLLRGPATRAAGARRRFRHPDRHRKSRRARSGQRHRCFRRRAIDRSSGIQAGRGGTITVGAVASADVRGPVFELEPRRESCEATP